MAPEAGAPVVGGGVFVRGDSGGGGAWDGV